jgi:hypothetical protein
VKNEAIDGCRRCVGIFSFGDRRIVLFQAGCIDRVVEQRWMIRRHLTNIPAG